MQGGIDRITQHLQDAETGLDSLAGQLGAPADLTHLAALEDAAKALHAAAAGLVMARQTGTAPAADLHARLAEAEESAHLIGRHLATSLDTAQLPARLRKWQADQCIPPVYLPPVPDSITPDDPDGYFAALTAYLGALTDAQRAAILATDLQLSPDITAALLKVTPDPVADIPPPVPLTDPLLPLVRDIFDDAPLVAFIGELAAQDRITCDPAKTVGFAHSIAPEFGALPLIYVPLEGTYRDLIQLSHHIGHGYHQMIAQQHGTVLNPLTPDIDEVIPLSCELRCESRIRDLNPDAGDWLAARRKREVSTSLRDLQQAMAFIAAALAGAAQPEIAPAALQDMPGFRPPALSSYGFGAVAAGYLWDRHGWRFDVLEEFARQADAAPLAAVFAA